MWNMIWNMTWNMEYDIWNSGKLKMPHHQFSVSTFLGTWSVCFVYIIFRWCNCNHSIISWHFNLNQVQWPLYPAGTWRACAPHQRKASLEQQWQGQDAGHQSLERKMPIKSAMQVALEQHAHLEKLSLQALNQQHSIVKCNRNHSPKRHSL